MYSLNILVLLLNACVLDCSFIFIFLFFLRFFLVIALIILKFPPPSFLGQKEEVKLSFSFTSQFHLIFEQLVQKWVAVLRKAKLDDWFEASEATTGRVQFFACLHPTESLSLSQLELQVALPPETPFAATNTHCLHVSRHLPASGCGAKAKKSVSCLCLLNAHQFDRAEVNHCPLCFFAVLIPVLFQSEKDQRTESKTRCTLGESFK